jgi:hypothetical protein
MHRNKLSWSMKSSNFLSEKTLVQFAHDNKDPGYVNITREPDSCSACKQIPSTLSKIRVQYRGHNTPPLIPILSQKNPIHIFVCYCFHLHQYREHWRAVVNTLMNIRVTQKTGEFLHELSDYCLLNKDLVSTEWFSSCTDKGYTTTTITTASGGKQSCPRA